MIDLTSDKIRTDIVKMDLSDENEDFFDKLNIDREDYTVPVGYGFYLKKLSDGYYFAKHATEFQICNEIAGRYLCNKVGLETSTLDLLLDDNKLKIAIPNYKNLELTYQYKTYDFDVYLNQRYYVSDLAILPKAYQKEQYKLISIDMMMEQFDRAGENMEEVIVNNSIHLSPIVDFAMSFDCNPFYSYYNSYVSIPKNTRGIDRFLNDFPKSYQYFIDVFYTSADDLIEYIESNYPIKVDNEIKEKYKKMVSKNQKILKMIK